MSKGIFAIGAASVVSLLAGVALTLVFTAEALDTVPDDGTDALLEVASELKKTGARLDRVERVVERELSATRRDVRGALDARAIGSSRISGHTAAPGAAASGDGGGGSSHAVREELAPLAGKQLVALGPMASWAEDEELRKKWTFASEQAALDAFGTPDEVAVRGSSEWWTYWNAMEGDKIASEYRVKFNNGRLVQTQLVKWEKPRPRPTAAR